ncbi:MAG: hypothetical protein ACRD50_14960 [Candidatus Acidiferrales bacterium]
MDRLAKMMQLFPKGTVVKDSEDANGFLFHEQCSQQLVRSEIGADERVESVTVSESLESHVADCSKVPRSRSYSRRLGTGRGLLLGDCCDRVKEIYGEASSEGPSIKGGRELELYYYAFDWAGSHVPQVMEVSYNTATNRVVEITLASPSL